jgi:sulfur carrier protein ThiS
MATKKRTTSRTAAPATIMVKVAKLGSKVNEVALQEGQTIQDAINASGVPATGLDMRLNGEAVDPNTKAEDGDVITLIPKIKGGQELVKIAQVGKKVEEVCIEEGTTIAEALKIAGVKADGLDMRLNGDECDENDEVEDGDIITLIPKIKGGAVTLVVCSVIAIA